MSTFPSIWSSIVSNDTPRASSIRWTFSATATIDTEELDLPSLIESGCAIAAKEGSHRAVYRVSLGGANYYWKYCKLSGPRAWARERLREPKTKLEFDRAVKLHHLGIGTFEPVAWGIQPGLLAGQSHLITREIEGAVPLEALIERYRLNPNLERIRKLSASFGAFCGRLAKNGIVHPDPHPGNILVRETEEDFEFYLLDLHALSILPMGTPATARRSEEQMIALNRWFSLRVSATQRLLGLKAFHAILGGTRQEFKELAKSLEIRTTVSNLRFWRSRWRRPLWHQKHFPIVKIESIAGRRAAECPLLLAERLARDPDLPFQDVAKLWKNSRSSTVVPLEFEGKKYIWKRFRIQSFGDAAKNLIRRSPTLHSWLMGQALLDRRLPTAKPMLVLHRRAFGIPHEGYILCERLEGVLELQNVLAALPPSDTRIRRELLHQLARTIRSLHARGIKHRDLKAANILVRIEEDKPRVWFVDLVGMKRARNIPIRRALRDLVRLNASFLDSKLISRGDRLRFLRTYMLWNCRGRGDWKAHWRWVAEETAKKIERNRKRGRVLK